MLKVAARLFAERGYSSVTVDDLGAAAGVSGPALYYHFDGKEALLGEMLIGVSQLLLDRASALAAAKPDDLLGALIAMHVDFAVEGRPLITVHFRELVNARTADRKRVRNLQNAYVDIWVDALMVAGKDLEPRTARTVVHAALGLMNSTPHSARLGRDEMSAILVAMTRAAFASMT